MGTTATYDLLSEQFFAAPFSTLERLRAEAPVYFLEPLQAFILTRADDIAAFIKDPAFSSRRAAERRRSRRPSSRAPTRWPITSTASRRSGGRRSATT